MPAISRLFEGPRDFFFVLHISKHYTGISAHIYMQCVDVGVGVGRWVLVCASLPLSSFSLCVCVCVCVCVCMCVTRGNHFPYLQKMEKKRIIACVIRPVVSSIITAASMQRRYF